MSLSRRSGTLQLTTPDDAGEIVFSHGKVVAAARGQSKDVIGDALIEAGIISPAIYQELLSEEQEERPAPELFESYGLAGEALEGALQNALKKIVFAMFAWDEGTFSFVLEDGPSAWGDFRLSGTKAVLSDGLNPQYLAIEGARQRDERSKEDSLDAFLARDSSQSTGGAPKQEARDLAGRLLRPESEDVARPSASASSEPSSDMVDPGIDFSDLSTDDEPTVEPPPAASTESIPTQSQLEPSSSPGVSPESLSVLIVDDDTLVVDAVATFLEGKVGSVHGVTKIGEAISSLGDLKQPTVVLSDLIIARSDGRGILGGLELLETVRERVPDGPVILFTDYENEEASQSAHQMGVQGFLMKPRKAQIQASGASRASDTPLGEFLDLLWQNVQQLLSEMAPNAAVIPDDAEPEIRGEAELLAYDLGRELASEFGEEENKAPPELPPPGATDDAVGVLRSMLAELVDPSSRDTITLLVLRFASDVVDRAALFLATRKWFVGLGGFSSEEESDRFVARVRSAKVPTGIDSVLAHVLRHRAPVRAPLEPNDGNEQMLAALGGSAPSGDIVALPLIADGRVAAILYGDNLSGRPLGRTDTLEIFLQQAGVAMERFALERRLEESRQQPIEQKAEPSQ